MFWICSKKIWLGWTLCTEVATMLFSEIYGSYFNVVAAVLSEASDGKLTDTKNDRACPGKGFRGKRACNSGSAEIRNLAFTRSGVSFHTSPQANHAFDNAPKEMAQSADCLIPESLCLIRTRPGWKMLIRCMLRTPSFSLTSTRTEIRMGIPPT